jgi:hypothetical protein
MDVPSRSAVTTVIVNFRTTDLTREAVLSFRSHYPDAPLLVIDNGSGIAGAAEIRRLAEDPAVRASSILLPRNRHHGPAMDLALRRLESPFVLFLDSDCVVRRGGFAEEMESVLEQDPGAYAVGKKIFMDARGFDVAESPDAHPYIRPICMMIRRSLYGELPPFRRHGAPCLENMIAAHRKQFRLVHFPVEEYVEHTGRGTASRHGYRLGLGGKWNHLLHRLGL